MKRIAVFGSEGMLGRAMTRIAEGEDFEIRGFDICDVDITIPENLEKIFDDYFPNIVINCAAFTDVDGCETKREIAMKVNAEGVYNVAREAEKRNAVTVHISTDYIFDGEKTMPYSEDDVPSPQNFYGESKLEGEKLLIKTTENHLIVRTEWLYGDGGGNFAFAMLEKQKNGEIINVVDDQVGSPTLTDELAKAVISLINNNCRGIYNFTSSGQCSWYEFAEKIFQITGFSANLNPVKSSAINRPAVRPKYSVLDCSKFKRDTGFVIQRWDESLKKFLISLNLH